MQLKITTVACVIALISGSAFAQDKGLDNPRRETFYEALEGKRVVFIPIAMGFDLTEAWNQMMQRQAEQRGYTVEVRDPNWSTEAGIRAMNSAIADKVDLIVLHNPDVQSYAKLVERAMRSGIKVLQLNMESMTPSDSYVGGDWVAVGEKGGEELAAYCGKGGAGPSNKIAIILGPPTGASTLYSIRGLYNVLEKHPEIEVVAQQSANYDPVKTRSIMSTILQQHPDLCGYWGPWDNSDVGAGSAVVEAGKQGQVMIATFGAGSKTTCDNIEKGLLTKVVNYDLPSQGPILNQQIAELLQSPMKPGQHKVSWFSMLNVVDASNNTGRNCWTMEELR